MTTAKRYTIVECHNDDEVWFKMKEVAHGEYVLYSDYKELEQELTKLKESQTQKSIIKLCNRVDKAEADKAELMKFVKEMNDLGKLSPMQLSDYTDIIYHGSLSLLNKHTDKPDALQALKKDHPDFGGKK